MIGRKELMLRRRRQITTMSQRPRRVRCSRLLLALLMAASCYRYQPTTLAPAPGTRVRVMLKTPMPVVLTEVPDVGQKRDVTRVLEATGIIVAAAADTISVRLGELRTMSGTVPDVENRVALIPVQSIAAVTEKRLDTARTLMTGAGLVLVGAGTVLIVLVVIVTKAAS